jgi:hypothetical protein
MRAIFALGAVCVLLTSPASATAAAPANADDAALMQIEAIQDRSADIWQGRHHYLYDDHYRPGLETMGAVPADARACATQPIRMRRSDGSTVVRRLRRCN